MGGAVVLGTQISPSVAAMLSTLLLVWGRVAFCMAPPFVGPFVGLVTALSAPGDDFLGGKGGADEGAEVVAAKAAELASRF